MCPAESALPMAANYIYNPLANLKILFSLVKTGYFG
jgi:hypothetical protein